MRSFFIACSILLVICVLILFNTFYVTSKTSELDAICEELAPRNPLLSLYANGKGQGSR